MEVTRIFDLLDRYAEHFRRPDVFAGKQNGTWKKYTYNDYIRLSNLVSYGLMELGYEKGDKIATISNNRPEWNFADMGMMQIGVVHVPIYSTISNDEFRHIKPFGCKGGHHFRQNTFSQAAQSARHARHRNPTL